MIEYDPLKFFTSWYRLGLAQELPRERLATGPYASVREVRNYYDTMALQVQYGLTHIPTNKILELGAGAGHWIDFYLNGIKAQKVVAVELTFEMTEYLRQTYAANPDVMVYRWDISEEIPAELNEERFDVINGIGIFFHLVNEEKFQRALANVAKLLAPRGVLAASDHYEGVGITPLPDLIPGEHAKDDFDTWKELRIAPGQIPLVNKRYRSLIHWRTAAAQVALMLHRKLVAPSDARRHVAPMRLGVWGLV